MTLRVRPVSMEIIEHITDEEQRLLAHVEEVDAGCYRIAVEQVDHDVTSWDELAQAVRQAMTTMESA